MLYAPKEDGATTIIVFAAIPHKKRPSQKKILGKNSYDISGKQPERTKGNMKRLRRCSPKP